MAGPITWQNVGQANFGDTANFMQLSNQQANQAFSNAGNRAKQAETKAISTKTNNILSQLGSIQDEDTLKAFISTIDLNDPNIDNNALVNAFGEQSKNILNRKESLVGIDAAQQNIAASQANMNLDQKRFDADQTQKAFQNTLASNQDTRAATSAGLSNKAANLQIQQTERQIADENFTRNLEAKTSELGLAALRGDVTVGGASAQILKEAAVNGRITDGIAQSNKLVQQLAETYKLTPAQIEDVTKATSRVDNKLVELANTEKAVKTKLINENYNGKEPSPPKDIDEQINTNSTVSDVVNQFVGDIAAIDKDAAESFANQTATFSTLSNMGYKDVLNQVTNQDSTLYTKFKNELKKQKVDNAPNEAIDPALLKAGLKAVNPVGQFQDGIDVDDLAKVMATIQKDRKTYQQYLKDVEEKVKPTSNKIMKLTESKGKILETIESDLKTNNQKTFADYLGGNSSSVNLTPSTATNQVDEFLANY